jgi:GST-like protein
LLGVLERILADGRPYLAGDYSIGDIMHYPWLQPLVALKAPPLLENERVVAWMERTAARPAVQRGMRVPA